MAYRILTISTLERSPLAVQVGWREDVLAPWWPYLQASVAIVLAYIVVRWCCCMRCAEPPAASRWPKS